jgi:hypothetical protein
VKGAREPDGVWLFQADDGRQVWVVQTREQAEREIFASRLTGRLVLCAPEAGGVRDVLVALRMFPPDLGTPPPEVIRELQAAAQTEARYEEGDPV